MTKLSKVTFTGESGEQYSFTAYSQDTTFNAVGAVYLITHRVKDSAANHNHTMIYVGQTGDLSNRPSNHHKTDCFDTHDANCICIYPEENEDRRLSIETDLRRAYNPPCNDQ